MDLISSSISNLIRLGIIDVSYRYSLKDTNHYVDFKDNSLFLRYKELLNSSEFKNRIDTLNEMCGTIDFDNIPKYPRMINGTASLTPLGKDFIRVCL